MTWRSYFTGLRRDWTYPVRCAVTFPTAALPVGWGSYWALASRSFRATSSTRPEGPSTRARGAKDTAIFALGSPLIVRGGRPAAALEMAVSISGPDWTWLRCHDVAVLADGKPVSAEAADHSGDVARFGVVETVVVRLDRANAETLAGAATIEGRVCRDEFTFSDRQVAGLRELWAQRSRPAAPPRKK